MLTSRVTMMLIHKVLDCVQVAISTGQREWSVTSLVDGACICTSVLSDVAIDVPYKMLTSRVTMMLIHKVLDNVQVAISTGQRKWGVTSLVDCTCKHMQLLLNNSI